MTNWPNIQEYRNFEAKFFDNPKHNYLTNSAAETEVETAAEDEFRYESENFPNNPRPPVPESKTVRCVITKDFEETFKKLDRGDGLAVSYDVVHPKIQETPTVEQTVADKVRLQNHLKWKKQKEEEYLQKKEAERIAQQKKKEEELRMEKVKKQKEKEREEKIREWQEQKAREKEEKKKEKMMMKVLEEELKEVTPVVDKEKLLEDWVKLKNKQKQMEAEKKAEILKKEEESKALRQNLAEMSYRQWKERVKGRMMTLPKNGYQIFGPKPIPVVKEDWNNDFTSNSPRHESDVLRSTKSNSSLMFWPPLKHVEDLSKDIFYLGDIKSRTPSFCHLKTAKSGHNFCNTREMPLKELQPGSISMKKNWSKNPENGFDDVKGFVAQIMKPKVGGKDFLPNKFPFNDSPDFMYSTEGDQNRCILPPQVKKPSRLFNGFPEKKVLPSKKKIDLYINPCGGHDQRPPPKQQKQQIPARVQKKASEEKVPEEPKKKSAPVRKPNVGVQRVGKPVKKGLSVEGRKPVETNAAKAKICRRSRSYDKKFFNEKVCTPSKSTAVSEEAKTTKSKASCCQKRKSRKLITPEVKKQGDSKGKKKTTKKNSFLSKSLSFNDSPYCVKKTLSKCLDKGKPNRRKSETKSDRAGQGRKSSTTKV